MIMIMSNFTLNKLEQKVLQKLDILKDDIFEPVRKDSKDELDSVSYIALKGFLDTEEGQEVLSMSIYIESQSITFHKYNKTTKERVQVTAKEFKTLLNSLTPYSTTSIDDL